MSSTLNLEAMRKEELHFVTRLSATTLRELIAQLPQDAQPQLWDRTKLLELSVEGKRYVIAGGEYRQKREWPGAQLAWKKPRGNSSAWRPSGGKKSIRKN